jgi:cystathionine gamma-synthase
MSEIPENARFATRAVHAGLRPDPHYGSIVPAIHQTSTYVQPAPGEFVGEYEYSRAANPRTPSASSRAATAPRSAAAWPPSTR